MEIKFGMSETLMYWILAEHGDLQFVYCTIMPHLIDRHLSQFFDYNSHLSMSVKRFEDRIWHPRTLSTCFQSVEISVQSAKETVTILNKITWFSKNTNCYYYFEKVLFTSYVIIEFSDITPHMRRNTRKAILIYKILIWLSLVGK